MTDLERRTHLRVERKLHLGGTFVCHAAILAGQIDVYPEYSGTAYTAILKHPPITGREAVSHDVASEYVQQFHLSWLAPLGFNNTFAILVRRADAARYGLKTISDVARVAPRWKAGFGYEFLERADGFRGMARAYGLTFAGPPTAMDLGITYRALADHKVDLDDRHYFPPYEAAFVVRGAVLVAHPEVAGALVELTGRISDDDMRRLNAAADVQHRDIREIAAEWLRTTLP